jgi:hypothetical protein
MNTVGKACVVFGIVGLAAVTVFAEYDMSWWTTDAGGAQASSGGTFELSGTIGQPDASASAALAGGSYSLTGGFWAVVPVCASFVAPDFDHDCDVDINDSVVFENCATGSGFGPVSVPCQGTDFDQDGDVDQTDFAVLQRCFSGDGVSAMENCDN